MSEKRILSPFAARFSRDYRLSSLRILSPYSAIRGLKHVFFVVIEFEIGSSFGSSSTSEAPSVSFPFPVPVSPISVVEDALESNPTPPLSPPPFPYISHKTQANATKMARVYPLRESLQDY